MSTALRARAQKDGQIASTVCVVSCLALLGFGCSKKNVDDVPVIAELSEFSLVDQDQQVFDRESMERGVWVTAFVFTHCRATCPRLTGQMKKLQGRLSDVPNTHFLSVSVDPRNDTPEVIKAYMAKNGLDETNWRFVTGREEAIQHFVVDGFQVGYGRTRWATELTHSNSFALVDEQARIRGYYGSDDDGIAELERDLRALEAARSWWR